MASSSVGMTELPYREVPFRTDGSDLSITRFAAGDDFPHEIILVSGARTSDDVMRGEETQLAGCDVQPTGSAIYIIPGTHAKHVHIRNGVAVDFKTYMTGEFFELLARKSILSASVSLENNNGPLQNPRVFAEGVRQARLSNVLHAAFLVRTNQIFQKMSAPDNLDYLSGLLIGAELKDLHPDPGQRIVLVGGEKLVPRYETALRILGIGSSQLDLVDADLALIRGQQKILDQHA
jgi:2-dehydro-3-deoxygalactonokinase